MIRTRLVWTLMGLATIGIGCDGCKKKAGDNSVRDGKTDGTQDNGGDKPQPKADEKKSKHPLPDIQGTGDN